MSLSFLFSLKPARCNLASSFCPLSRPFVWGGVALLMSLSSHAYAKSFEEVGKTLKTKAVEAKKDGDNERFSKLKVLYSTLEKIEAGKLKVDVTDKTKSTPLMWAAEVGEIEALEYLLAKGADIALKDASGKTAQDKAGAASVKKYILSKIPFPNDDAALAQINLKLKEAAIPLNPLSFASISPDGKFALIGAGSFAALIDLRSLEVSKIPFSAVEKVVWSPYGPWVCLLSMGNNFQGAFYNLDTQKIMNFESKAHGRNVVFDEKNKHALVHTSWSANFIFLYDLESGELVDSDQQEIGGVYIDLMADGSHYLVALHNKTLKIKNVATKEVVELKNPSESAPFFVGNSLVWIGEKDKIHLYDVSSKQNRTIEAGGAIKALFGSKDKKSLIAYIDGKHVKLFDSATGAEQKSYPLTGRFSSLLLSSNGQFLAGNDTESQKAVFLHLETGKVSYSDAVINKPPLGNFAAAAPIYSDRKGGSEAKDVVRVTHLLTGKQQLIAPDDSFLALWNISPAGKYVIIGGKTYAVNVGD